MSQGGFGQFAPLPSGGNGLTQLGGGQQDNMYDFDYDMNVGPSGAGATFQPSSKYGGQPSSYMKVPPSQMGKPRLMTGQQGSAMPQSRMMTGSRDTATARPMTSVSGAGFNSNPNKGQSFDPLNAGGKGPAPALASKTENSPEDMAKEMEKKVNLCVEESADAAAEKDYERALEKAKDAVKKERQLTKHRENNNLIDSQNLELSGCAQFNLANAFHMNQMYEDAIQMYGMIVKNKQYNQSGRLRVNMGNIFYEQKKYPNAIRMYRMALDQIPNTQKEQKFKIMRNIGNAFVKLGQFQDAIQQFDAIMEGNPDFQSGFNLIVCYFALGDADKLKLAFTQLLAIPIQGMAEEDDDEDEAKAADAAEATGEKAKDGLRAELKERQKVAHRYISTAAKVCAPVVEKKDWIKGYDTVIEALKPDHESIASEMEVCKAHEYLKRKQFEKAIEVLRGFEKKDVQLKAMASTNLSFLYFLEGDYQQANKYADLAVKHDRYNAKALVNKGNCLFMRQEFERAKEMYLEAIGVEADCVEAIFNLGIVNKRMDVNNEAQQAFEKLHSIIPNNPEVIYQIANLYDQIGNPRLAAKWFNILYTRVPTDPGVLSRLGAIFNKDDDEAQAFHYHYESYRYFPVNLDVISWLGVFYVKSELYEKAIQFFDRASQIQPNEVKWKLMVTGCYRRMGSFQKALQLYEEIHQQYPENLECLRYLVAICRDLGQRYDQYEQKLHKLERAHAARQQSTMAHGGGGGALTRMGAAQQSDDRFHPPSNSSKRAPQRQQFSDELPPPKVMAPPTQQRGGQSSVTNNMRQAEKEVDDFDDADLDDLLPND